MFLWRGELQFIQAKLCPEYPVWVVQRDCSERVESSPLSDCCSLLFDNQWSVQTRSSPRLDDSLWGVVRPAWDLPGTLVITSLIVTGPGWSVVRTISKITSSLSYTPTQMLHIPSPVPRSWEQRRLLHSRWIGWIRPWGCSDWSPSRHGTKLASQIRPGHRAAPLLQCSTSDQISSTRTRIKTF